MKRARTEQMQALVLSYLKKRNYTDSETSFKLEFRFEDTLQEMTTHTFEETDISTSNSTSLSVFCIDEYFTAFTELLDFVDNLPEENKDIIEMVYPVYCQMYLDLVMSGRKGDAGIFFRHFEIKLESRCENQSPSLKTLARIIQPSDLKSSEEVLDFRKKKKIIKMNSDSNALFLRFLYASTCLVLFKVVNLHFSLKTNGETGLFDLLSGTTDKIRKSENAKILKRKRMVSAEHSKVNGVDEPAIVPKPEPVTLSAPSLLSPPTPVSVPADPAQPIIPDINMKTLQASFRTVQELKPSISNICVHRLSDTASSGFTHATVSNDFSIISTGSEDSTVNLWNLSVNSGPNTSTYLKKDFASGIDEKQSLKKCDRFSPDVSRLHLGCDFFETVKTRLESGNYTNNSRKCLRAHSDTVSDSSFSLDNKFLLTSSEDTTVRLWDVSSGKNKAIYRGHVYPVWCVSMSNYNLYFATGSYDKTARLWTTERTYPLRTFAGHHGDVECVAFHNNVSYLATSDKSIRLWDLASGKTVRLLLGHWAAVTCLAFSKNGKYLASSGEDGRIRMWDIASGALIKEMRGHEGAVYSLDFSPDDTMIASGGTDSFLRVWNTRTCQASTTKNSTETNDPDFIGRWQLSSSVLHTVKFESCNLLHCVISDR